MKPINYSSIIEKAEQRLVKIAAQVERMHTLEAALAKMIKIRGTFNDANYRWSKLDTEGQQLIADALDMSYDDVSRGLLALSELCSDVPQSAWKLIDAVSKKSLP